MKRSFFAFSLVFASALSFLASCAMTPVTGNGVVVSSSRSLPDASITGLRVSGVGTVRLVQSQGEPSISVTTDSNLQDYIETYVDGGCLVIHPRPFVTIVSYTSLDFQVSLPSISSMVLDGAVKLEADGLSGGSLALRANGASKLTLANLALRGALSVDLAGSNSVEATGSADSLDLSLDGTASFSGASLLVQDAKVGIRGMGNAELRAQKSLSYSISGVGNVYYYGADGKAPVAVSGTVTGLGQARFVQG
jgi:hypothetical protein